MHYGSGFVINGRSGKLKVNGNTFKRSKGFFRFGVSSLWGQLLKKRTCFEGLNSS